MKKLLVLFVSLLFVFFAFSLNSLDLTESATANTEDDFIDYIEDEAPSELAFVAVQRVAHRYIMNKEWNEAASVFKENKSLFGNMTKRFDKIIELLESDDENLIIENLGKGINTSWSEYCPVPSVDGTKMYFTGYDRTDGFGVEDIWVSEYNAGKWQPASNLGSSINTDSNESLDAISPDGKRLLIFGNYENSFGNGDMFYADRINSDWSEIKHFSKPINSEDFEADGFISSDGKAMFFASDREDCVGDYIKKGNLHHGSYWGNSDIYVCIWDGSNWSDPINLGNTINTEFAERTPFLHADSKTLYFSSEGHYGIGGLDVFKATRLKDDSWTEWSKPVNLGKNINSVNDDWGYKVSTSGDIAYFNAYGKSEGYGKSDIFSITLPEAAKPEAIAIIKGKVTNEKNNPLEATILWKNKETNKIEGQLKSDFITGNYFLPLPINKHYQIIAEKEDYDSFTKDFDFRGQEKSIQFIEDIVLEIPKVEEEIVVTPITQEVEVEIVEEIEIPEDIYSINFDIGKYEIKSEYHSILDNILRIAKSNDYRISISGYSDSKGNRKENLVLSNNRAAAISVYFIKNGFSRKRIIICGFGEDLPVASNNSREGRSDNRRTEIKFVK